MASPENEPRRLECLSFISSGTPEADAARAELADIYGDCDPDSSDVVVALGGDGLMLQTLHRFMGRN
jgi:NAD+ kinase